MNFFHPLVELEDCDFSADAHFQEQPLFFMDATKREYPLCAVFRSNKDSIPCEQKPLNEVLLDIYNCTSNAIIEPARTFYSIGRKDEYDKLKAKLPGFTIAGTFEPTRSIANLVTYSGFIILDIDKLGIDQLATLYKIICSLSYTFSCFVSPSGAGLKIIVKVNTDAVNHKATFKHLTAYYERKLNISIDKSGSDLSRLCYYSCDKNIYVNEDSSIYTPPIIESILSSIPELKEKENTLESEAFDRALKLTEKTYKFIEGERNNFVFLLANNCNRNGVKLKEAETRIKEHYNYNEAEVAITIRGAYERGVGEFAKFANFARLQSTNQAPEINEEDSVEDYLKNTPTIPEDVYESLPDLLKIGASAFIDYRKRDVFLTSALAIFSGCLPNVTGIYFQERVYPHMYTFVVAPAASGKGVMKNAKRLADKYHQKILQLSRDAQLKYEIELAELKQFEKSKKKGEPAPEKPREPPFKIVFIPANCSKARMVEHLQANEGQGIICETEADTMSGAKKQDWGDYSDILRSAFHHEKISISRKTGNEYVEINEPRLAVSLTGTPAQVPKLIASAEDGLFSRYLFYAYKNSIQWQDPSPKSHTIVFNDHFETLSVQVLELNEFLEQSPSTIELSEDQWKIINTEFPAMLAEVITFTSEDAAGVVYRLGLILFRICMIFSALRKFENGELTSIVICTDCDFNSALKLVQIYLAHSLLMFNNLPKQSETMQFQSGNGKRKFFDALPPEFTRKEAIGYGKTYSLSARTVDAMLKSCSGVSLAKTNPGHYNKI